MIYIICLIMFIYVCFIFAVAGRGRHGKTELEAWQTPPSLGYGPDPNPQMDRCVGCSVLIPFVQDVYSECGDCKKGPPPDPIDRDGSI